MLSSATAAANSETSSAKSSLHARYITIRSFSRELCAPLAPEDYVVQSMPDASPTKWHLAHTTWFFETFVLAEAGPGYRPFHPRYGYLFNSYYEAAGERHARPRRGMLTRPTVDEVLAYRAHVDDHMMALLDGEASLSAEQRLVVETGLHHEQQHQELMLTDLLHLFGENPLRPAYRTTDNAARSGAASPLRFVERPGGLVSLGHERTAGFAYDNESPRHRAFVEDFEIADRLITAGEMIDFIDDGGYAEPAHWLSEGWDAVRREGWHAPLGWEKRDGQWSVMTLAGMIPVVRDEPVCRVSFFEADAYARWAGARLPTEAEWEAVAADQLIEGRGIEGNFVDQGRLRPAAASAAEGGAIRQLFGDVWEWTSSAYLPYPGFQPLSGALGEYNGKFMFNQMVLRGGSCLTSKSHMRATYRNFFPGHARWQMSGFRLARPAATT